MLSACCANRILCANLAPWTVRSVACQAKVRPQTVRSRELANNDDAWAFHCGPFAVRAFHCGPLLLWTLFQCGSFADCPHTGPRPSPVGFDGRSGRRIRVHPHRRHSEVLALMQPFAFRSTVRSTIRSRVSRSWPRCLAVAY